MTVSRVASDRLGLGLLARYGIGQAGAQVFRDAPAALLPLFLTTMLGVPPWMAGLTVIIPKLWVIICDPLIGSISDRMNDRHGRRPFLVAGAILTNVGFIALFSVASLPNPVLTAALVSVLFLVSSTAFSAFSVPYLALASELSDDAAQRSRLISGRMIGATIGVLVGMGLGQPLVMAFGGKAHGWTVMAIILAAICLVAMLVTALTVGRPRLTAHERHNSPLFGSIGAALREPDFRWLTLTYLIQCIGQACGYTVLNFVFLYNVGNVRLILPFVLLMSVGSVASQPVWLAVGRRLGNIRGYIISALGWSILTVTAFTITPGHDIAFTLPLAGPVSTQQAIVLARALPLAFFNCGFLLFVLSMLTDTISRIRHRNGTINEGVYSGIFSATEKLSFAIAPVFAGIVMSLSHFTASSNGVHAQSAEAVTGVLLLYSLIPAAVIALSCITVLRYARLSAEPVAESSLSPVIGKVISSPGG